MAIESEDLNWEPSEPQSLIKSLKCPVCWDYLVKPHTLSCGHTFCLRCLQNLARIVRSSKHRIPLDRLRFRCPSCRKSSLARPILKRKAAINYAMKEIMNEWFNSPYSSGSVDFLKLRSIGCQATPAKDVNEAENNDVFHNIKVEISLVDDANIESSLTDEDDIISKTEYKNVLFHKINYKSKLEDTPKSIEQNESNEQSPSADENEVLSEENTVTSSSEEESEQEIAIAPLFGNLRLLNEDDNVVNNRPRFTRFHATSVSGVLAILFTEMNVIYQGIRNSRSRTVLTVFWFLYGGLIVYISRSFLPWMTFYTIIYFIIIYAEMSPAPLFR